jgi:zinc transporter 1/2/3
LVHILPEAHEMLDEMPMANSGDPNMVGCGEGGIQWSYLVCLISFSCILFLDKVLFNNTDIAEHNHTNQTDFRKSLIQSSDKNKNVELNGNIENNFKERISSKYKIALRMSRSSNLKTSLKDSFNCRESDLQDIEKQFTKPKVKVISNVNGIIENLDGSNNLTESLIKDPKVSSDNLLEQKNQENNNKYLNPPKTNEVNITINNINQNQIQVIQEKKSDASHQHFFHEGHQHQNLVGKNDSILTSLILLVAMGIHGFFSLLAFGLEKNNTSAMNLFIALIVHKWSEGLTVGISFMSAGIDKKKSVWFMVFLTLLSPLGQIIGMILSSMNEKIQGVFMALSAGTFLYIATAEIIVEEFSIARNKYSKFLVYTLGILFIVLITAYA